MRQSNRQTRSLAPGGSAQRAGDESQRANHTRGGTQNVDSQRSEDDQERSQKTIAEGRLSRGDRSI
jgi:hypothetical protein